MERRNRGGGNVGCIVGLLVIAAAVVVLLKVVPAKVAMAELRDFCERQAETASFPRNTDEVIGQAILAKAKELKLPLKAEGLRVWRDSGTVYIEARYRVVLKFPVYTYNWDVTHDIERVMF